MTHKVVVATRNSAKLREIRDIAREFGKIEVSAIPTALPVQAEEDELECFNTFRGNARAKARFFAEKLQVDYVLAEDSGLCVDALGGAPGVRSKRFAARTDLEAGALDGANNELLLQRMQGVAEEFRGARFVCVAVLVGQVRAESTFTGICCGEILVAPRGSAGFGYDPLFCVRGENCTLAEMTPVRKNQCSHRARALRKAFSHLSRRG